MLLWAVRYDAAYEEGGHDYPVGHGARTEQRNFEAGLTCWRVDASMWHSLVSHRFALDHAGEAYDLLASATPSLGHLSLQYPNAQVGAEAPRALANGAIARWRARTGKGERGLLGRRQLPGRVLMPAFKAAGAQLQTVVSAGGASAAHFGRKYGVHARVNGRRGGTGLPDGGYRGRRHTPTICTPGRCSLCFGPASTCSAKSHYA